MTTQQAETLSQLVAERAGKASGGNGKITFVALHERSVDPETGYQPSANLLWKVATDQDVKVHQALVRAIAAGLGLPLARVQAAAAYQYTGYVATRVNGGTVVHDPGAVTDDLPRSRAALARWDEEESEA